MVDFAYILPVVIGLVISKRVVTDETKDKRGGRSGIRCPACRWQPAKGDRWCCGPGGCLHVWNTFDTRGRCPNCGKQWQSTLCLNCATWSPHDEWYEESGED